MNWKYNQKMKIKVHLSIGRKVQLENGRNMHLQKSNYKMEICSSKCKLKMKFQLQMEMKIQFEN